MTVAVVSLTVRASGWSTLMRDDQELLSNMQAYIAHLLQCSDTQQSGSSAMPADSSLDYTSSDTSSQVVSYAASRWSGWTLLQRSLVGWLRQLMSIDHERFASASQPWQVLNVHAVLSCLDVVQP